MSSVPQMRSSVAPRGKSTTGTLPAGAATRLPARAGEAVAAPILRAVGVAAIFAAGHPRDRWQQVRQRTDGRGFSRAAMAHDQDAADPRLHQVEKQRQLQLLLADDAATIDRPGRFGTASCGHTRASRDPARGLPTGCSILHSPL